MKRTLRLTLAAMLMLAGTWALPGCNGANDNAINELNDGPKGFMVKTLTRGDRTRKYGLFVPLNYAATRKYPCIIFLHGLGEGGDDAHANLRVGLAPFVALKEADFPFICIFPQSPDGSWHPDTQQAIDVISELDEVSKSYSIDQDCVSLTGLSTGGFGTWAIGATYKDRFAALVPMGSSEDPSKYAPQLLDMPIRSFHNGSDIFAGIWNDSSMVEKIKTLGGTKAEFTQTNGAGHDCWDPVYSDGELFIWLQQQRRHASSTTATPTKSSASAGSQSTRANAAALINTSY